MTSQCIKDICNYLYSNDYISTLEDKILGMPVMYNDEFNRSHIWKSKKGIKRKLSDRWGIGERSKREQDKYFLEYIGHILRKHNITKFSFIHGVHYKSIDWKFENIKLI